MTEPLERLQDALADRYRIERELGAGGMATVYLAEDLKHRRRVAVKVLRPELSAVLGAERFLKEIELTANLQHSHLLPLFDSGEAAGLLYYVMPYVEGESLRARLDREKQLGVEEAVRITSQVASALDYAHRHGIIHRDIKPENILVHEGQALIADFGIALALRQAGGNRLTETGLSLGTPQYMSPEQAGGDRALDPRSDVYSLACVLYEMLAGEPPHTGPTVQAVIAKLLSAPVRPVTELRTTVPVHVAQALDVALAKLPADRFAGAAEFDAALTGAGRVKPPSPVTGSGLDAGRRVMDRRILAIAAAALMVGGILGAGLRGGASSDPRAPAIYDVGLPDSAPIAFTAGPWGEGWTALDVSPGGDFVVYVAQRGTGTELWYRSLTDTVARPIPGTFGAYNPMLSPDGMSVAYFAANQLMVAPLTGGAPVPIANVDRPWGGQWPATGRIIISDSNGTVVRAHDPSSRTALTVLRGRCPIPRLFGADEVTCTEGNLWVADEGGRPFYIGPIDQSGTGERLVGSQFTPVDGSTLVFLTQDGALAGASFDLATRVTGRPVTLVGGIRREGFAGAGQFALSQSGVLAFAPGQNAEVGRFARIGEDGASVDLPMPPGAYHRFDLAPDGQRLVSMLKGLNGQELWLYDVITGRGERLLSASFVGEPRWSPDGRSVLVASQSREGEEVVTLRVVPGSSTPPDTVLGSSSAVNVFGFVADSLVLGTLFNLTGDPVRVDLRNSPPQAEPISRSAYFGQELSPEGRWLSYSSGGVDGWETFVEPFPANGKRFKVSPRGGLEPQWRSASELIFRNGSTWYVARIDPRATNPVGEAHPVFADPRFLDTAGRSNDLAPDGSMLYVRGTGQTSASFLRVIPDFTKQVRARLKQGS